MPPLKVRKVGNSLAIILTTDVLARFGQVKEGDILYPTEAPQGITLTAYDPEVARQIELGEKFMAQYRETFAALAK